jgi:hypothetical protein
MQTLPILIAEMRMLGVKRLELELDQAVIEEPSPETEPAPPMEEKDPGACVALGCAAPRAGMFGGAIAGKYCRAHALAEAGVKT